MGKRSDETIEVPERLAVIETKLKSIEGKLDEITSVIREMGKEMKETAKEFQIRKETVDTKLSIVDQQIAKQSVINSILSTIGGAALAGVVGIGIKIVWGV